MNFSIDLSIGIFKSKFSNWYLFQKPSWKLRGNSFRGSFYLVKGKAFERGGEIWNPKNASCNHILIPLTIWKGFEVEKIFQKICKNKQVVQMWSKMLNKRKAIHIHLVILSIGLIPSNLCTFFIQTSYISTLYICFGLCWHQSPKRGDWKGNWVNHFL